MRWQALTTACVLVVALGVSMASCSNNGNDLTMAAGRPAAVTPLQSPAERRPPPNPWSLSLNRVVSEDPAGWVYALDIQLSAPDVELTPDATAGARVTASWSSKIVQTPKIAGKPSPLLGEIVLHAMYPDDGLCVRYDYATEQVIEGNAVCEIYTVAIDDWGRGHVENDEITVPLSHSGPAEKTWLVDGTDAEALTALVQSKPMYWVLTVSMTGGDLIDYSVCTTWNDWHVMGVSDADGHLIGPDGYAVGDTRDLDAKVSCTFGLTQGGTEDKNLRLGDN